MDRTGLVDLGSNSARLVVYEFERGRGFWLVDEIREVIRLGAGIARTGRMSEAGIGRAVAALRAFADYAQATDLPALRIMATSAVRSAANAAELLDPVRRMGLDIDVLSGEQEALQGVLAVANSSRLTDAWVMDLGGGSLQLSRMGARAYERGRASPLGTIRVTEQFLADDPPTSRQVEQLEAAVDEHLGGDLDRLRHEALPLVAMGGTVRNLARAAQRQSEYPWRHMHGYALSTDAIETLTERMLGRTARQRRRIRGINPYRGDVILAGALVVRRLMRRAGLSEVTISGYGMREGGLLMELLPPPHLLDDVRRFHVRNLLWRYPQPAAHNRRVVALSRQIFDELRPLHGYGGDESSLLEAAAELHDIGKAIHFRDHAKHGGYLLAGSPLPGFDHREQALLSLLVRYHRGGRPAPPPYRRLMRSGDRRLLAQLAICLRLAEYLERSRSGRVSAVRARLDERSVTLELRAQGEPWVEVWETQKQSPAFEAAFARRLRLEVVPDSERN